jgi:hypothetical protein
VWKFDSREFVSWGYGTMGDSLIPGHAHFPLLRFFEEQPEHDRYWLVEDDVAYQGQWQQFFGSFDKDDSDLLACHLRLREQEPKWYWWDTVTLPLGVTTVSTYIRSLLVVARYSRHALDTISRNQRAGWCGHAEVLIPTMIAQAGLKIADIGGRGPFTPPARRGRFYSSYSDVAGSLKNIGSVRYRPATSTPGLRSDRLYHPVKVDQQLPQLPLGQRIGAVMRSVRHHLEWRFRAQKSDQE